MLALNYNAATRLKAVTTIATRVMKIKVALPSNTISLSRSGFIRSFRCISLLLAAEHERTPSLFLPAIDRFVFMVAKYCAQ